MTRPYGAAATPAKQEQASPPRILHNVIGNTYKGLRLRAGLSIDEVAAAIGKTRSIVYRFESGEQLLKPELEKILLEKANCSKEGLFEIMCEMMAEDLGRPVRIAPRGQYLPEAPLKRAADYYALHQGKLPPELRERIEAKLHAGRLLDAVSDQCATLAEKEIRLLIAEAIDEGTSAEAEPAPES